MVITKAEIKTAVHRNILKVSFVSFIFSVELAVLIFLFYDL